MGHSVIDSISKNFWFFLNLRTNQGSKILSPQKASIKYSMMIRAKKNHIFNLLLSALFNWNKVTDIIARLIPPTNKTFITTHKECETIPHSFNTFSIRGDSSSAQISAMSNSTTSQRTEPSSFSRRRVVLERFPAYFAIFRLFKSWGFLKILSSAFIIAFSRAINNSLFRKPHFEYFTANGAGF